MKELTSAIQMNPQVSINIIHFHNGTGGGVLSVIKNLLIYQQDHSLEQHIIYTINSKKPSYYKHQSNKVSSRESYFFYSTYWNFSHTCKKLSKLIHNHSDLLIAHDWLEMRMISTLGLPNPVIFFLHGDYTYYYDLAKLHSVNIDIFICVSAPIYNKLKILLPDRINDIYYKRFPVGNPMIKSKKSHENKIIFIGRCEKSKGYDIIPEIDQKLRESNCFVKWTIFGEGDLLEKVTWPKGANVEFMRVISNEKVLSLLSGHDIIVLPTIAEGMPITIVEAMKAGVIPLVNNIPGGIQELIQNGITGYLISNNDPADYAVKIKMILNDFDMMNYISSNCISYSHEYFNPIINTAEIESLYSLAIKQNTIKQKLLILNNRLDNPLIPNSLVTAIRKIRKRFHFGV